jgi:[acyl-carrier-protein] S-malonyltransferase
MKRAALICPGRGSYTDAVRGTLDPADPYVRRAEALRGELESLVALDHADTWRPGRHLRPANASALIHLIAHRDALAASARQRVVAVSGNSMGWYTALVVAGALDFDDGFRLVQEMALLQEESAREQGGGQLLYPLVDESWRPVPELAAAVQGALAAAPGQAFPSIHLGGYVVLAGTEAGLAELQRTLPAIQHGKQRYPFRLVQHGPYHTPLAAEVSAAARVRLAGLDFRRPRVTLVDGQGRRWTPWSTDPARLADYTLGAQVTTPYDLSSAVRVLLREHAPDLLVLPGPGNTLGGVVGQLLVREGWRGLRSRQDFASAQETDQPMVESMGRG